MYITVILASFNGCEAWSFTLREEHRLKALKNRAVRLMFGP